MERSKQTKKSLGSDDISGHQPVLHTIALVQLMHQIGFGPARWGLNTLRSQLLILIWRFPQVSLDKICQRYYLDRRSISRSLAQLRKQGYIKVGSAASARKKRTPLLQRQWQLSARAYKIIPDLLRSEEKFNRAFSELGLNFSAHWCYNMQNLNSTLRQQLHSSEKEQSD